MFNYFVEIVANCIMYVLTGVNYFEGIGINDFDTIGMYQTVYNASTAIVVVACIIVVAFVADIIVSIYKEFSAKNQG